MSDRKVHHRRWSLDYEGFIIETMGCVIDHARQKEMTVCRGNAVSKNVQ